MQHIDSLLEFVSWADKGRKRRDDLKHLEKDVSDEIWNTIPGLKRALGAINFDEDVELDCKCMRMLEPIA